LDNLIEAGYSDLFLIVGYHAELMADFLKKYNYKAKVINQFEILGKDKYGTACPIKCVKNIIGNENFLVVYGDNLYSINDLKDFNIDDNYTYIGGYFVFNPQKYGVLTSEDGFLKEIIEKPKTFMGNLINAGLYKFTPEIFKKVEQISISLRGEYELTDAISLLAKERKVKIKEIKDYWLDFGNPADIMKLSKFLKNNQK